MLQHKKAAMEYYRQRREKFKPVFHDGGIDLSWSAILNTLFLAENPFITTGLVICGITLGWMGRRQFPTAVDIPISWYRRSRMLHGLVVTVNDSDNIRIYHMSRMHRFFYHTGLMRKSYLLGQRSTINIRLAGIDCPEGPHFGNPGQPYYEESKNLLERITLHKMVRVQLHRLDQYQRAVCSVHVPHLLFFSNNVSLLMVQSGMATVYRNAGAEYGGIKEMLLQAEQLARYVSFAMHHA